MVPRSNRKITLFVVALSLMVLLPLGFFVVKIPLAQTSNDPSTSMSNPVSIESSESCEKCPKCDKQNDNKNEMKDMLPKSKIQRIYRFTYWIKYCTKESSPSSACNSKFDEKKFRNFGLENYFCNGIYHQFVHGMSGRSDVERTLVIILDGNYPEFSDVTDIFPCIQQRDLFFPDGRPQIFFLREKELFTELPLRRSSPMIKKHFKDYDVFVRVDCDDAMPSNFEDCWIKYLETYRPSEYVVSFVPDSHKLYLDHIGENLPYKVPHTSEYSSCGLSVSNPPSSEFIFHSFMAPHKKVHTRIKKMCTRKNCKWKEMEASFRDTCFNPKLYAIRRGSWSDTNGAPEKYVLGNLVQKYGEFFTWKSLKKFDKEHNTNYRNLYFFHRKAEIMYGKSNVSNQIYFN